MLFVADPLEADPLEADPLEAMTLWKLRNFTSHRRKDFWYTIGDLIREEGITLMRGDVLVFVARSDSRHILFEGGEQMI